MPVPSAKTESATGVAEDEATLNGTVNPEDLPPAYQFGYDITTTTLPPPRRNWPARSPKTLPFPHPAGIAVDDSGNLWTADQDNG